MDNDEQVIQDKEDEIKKAVEIESKQLAIKTKKKRIRLGIISAAIIVILIAGWASSPLITKELQYRKAQSFVKDKYYDSAIEIFKNMQRYKNSTNLEVEANYLAGKEALNNKDYQKSIDYLKNTETYSDTKELLKQAYYGEALKTYDNYKTNQKLDDIRTSYRLIGFVGNDYLDSNQLLNEMKNNLNAAIFNEAVKLFNKKYFVEARDLFREVGDYKDTNVYLNSVYYKIEGSWGFSSSIGNKVFDVYTLKPQGKIESASPELGPKYTFTYYWSPTKDNMFGFSEAGDDREILYVNDTYGGKIKVKDTNSWGNIEEHDFISKTTSYTVKKEPAIGMSADEVRNSTWGKPKKINRSTYASGTSEQWVYDNYRYIYLDNGIVTAIQD
jgi:hypothetical protein